MIFKEHLAYLSRRGRTEISESLQRPLNDLGIFTKYKNSKGFEIALLVFPRRKELEHEFTLVSPHVGLGNRLRLFMKDHLFWVPFMSFFFGGGYVALVEKGQSLSVSGITSQALPECHYRWSPT